jgi:hypothetical protein
VHSPTRLPPGATDSGPEPTPGPTDPDPVQRLGRSAIVWRSAVLVGGTLLVIWGTVFGTDNAWPFGPMSQFAFRAGPNDGIHSVFLQVRNTEGRIFIVPISPGQVGTGRAEVEGQMTRIRADPALLKDLAVSYHEIHPNEPPLEQLWLRDRITEFHQGRKVGERVDPMVGWPEK